MKAIAIVDIDDKLLKHYKDFAIESELIATSKKDTWWRRSIRYVGEIKLKPMPERQQDSAKICISRDAWLLRKGYNACINEILGEDK